MGIDLGVGPWWFQYGGGGAGSGAVVVSVG